MGDAVQGSAPAVPWLSHGPACGMLAAVCNVSSQAEVGCCDKHRHVYMLGQSRCDYVISAPWTERHQMPRMGTSHHSELWVCYPITTPTSSTNTPQCPQISKHDASLQGQAGGAVVWTVSYGSPDNLTTTSVLENYNLEARLLPHDMPEECQQCGAQMLLFTRAAGNRCS